jgi:hypothetical protein
LSGSFHIYARRVERGEITGKRRISGGERGEREREIW